MDRPIVYPGEELIETDHLNASKFALMGLAKLSELVLGPVPIVAGFGCTPGSGLTVAVAAGQVYQMAQADATAYSSLGTDTHSVLKQGLLMDAIALACPAPGVAGQSINYLIEVTYQDVDTGSVVLPFYNASNPTIPYSGPAGAGTPTFTVRSGKATLAAKAGTPAATGSQTTPAVDAGYIALWVVTVANGAVSIVSGNITSVVGAPFLPYTLPQIGPAVAAAAKFRYVNGSINMTVGADYIVDSTAGPFTMTLPAAPAVGDSFELIDLTAKWGTNPVTLGRNGNTIMGFAQDLILNVSDQRFTIWWSANNDWRLS